MEQGTMTVVAPEVWADAMQDRGNSEGTNVQVAVPVTELPSAATVSGQLAEEAEVH
jgi:hypothetical protein